MYKVQKHDYQYSSGILVRTDIEYQVHEVLVGYPVQVYRSPVAVLRGAHRYTIVYFARLMAMAIRPSSLMSAFLYTLRLYCQGSAVAYTYRLPGTYWHAKYSAEGLKLTVYQVFPARTVLAITGTPRSTGTLLYTEITGYSPVRHSNLVGTINFGDTTRPLVLLWTLISSGVKSTVSRGVLVSCNAVAGVGLR